MHKRQAAKPLCRPAKIWNYFFDFNVVVCNRAGCANNLTTLSFSGNPGIQFLVQLGPKQKTSAFKSAIFALFKYKNDNTQQYVPQK